MSRPKRASTRPAPMVLPVTVTVHAPLLDAVRAAYPVARDWTDSRVVAACVAMALKMAQRPVTAGTVEHAR